MILDYGNTHFDDVNGEVWTDTLKPYSHFRGILSVEEYLDYRDEFMERYGDEDDDAANEDDYADDEDDDDETEGDDSDAEEIG